MMETFWGAIVLTIEVNIQVSSPRIEPESPSACKEEGLKIMITAFFSCKTHCFLLANQTHTQAQSCCTIRVACRCNRNSSPFLWQFKAKLVSIVIKHSIHVHHKISNHASGLFKLLHIYKLLSESKHYTHNYSHAKRLLEKTYKWSI